MAQLHISTPDGGQAVHSEEQVRDLWEQGSLADSTLCWKKGMTNWQPLREYLSAAADEPPVAAPAAPARFSFVKDPTGLTSFLVTMLWLSLGIEVIMLLSNLAQLQLATTVPIPVAAAKVNDTRQQIIAIVFLCTFIVTGITFLKWIYRANLNSRGFGAPNMEFTSGWAVGWYFVPFANLIMPFKVMKEIWQVSGNPQHWKGEPGSPLLGWWWGLWLTSNFLGQLSSALSKHIKDAESLKTATITLIIAAIVGIPRCWVALKLVMTIHRRQQAIVEQGPSLS